MQVETWRDTLGTRLDSQLTFLMEADRLKTVLRAMTRRIEDGSPELWRAAEAVFADAVAKGWIRP
jgi:hypothetical protein